MTHPRPARTPIHRTIASLGIVVVLGGCALVSEKSTALLSSGTPAIAVVGGRVLWGKADFSSAREATLQLQTDEGPVLACSGTLRHTSTTGGVVGLVCSDGSSSSVPFQSLSALSGAGRTSQGDTALTYGLSPDKASGYLAVPADKLVRAVKEGS